MREQPTRVKTGAVKKAITAAAVALAIVGFAVAAVLLYLREPPPYTPPPLEPNATEGVPNPPDNMAYGNLDAAGKFAFGVAGTMYQQADSSLNIYFTNPEENECFLMCEVVDVENDVTLYKSGLLRPGEYVENLKPLKKIKNEAIKIEVFVYALEFETYISVGQVSLDNILQPN